jgi:hypothetical protein
MKSPVILREISESVDWRRLAIKLSSSSVRVMKGRDHRQPSMATRSLPMLGLIAHQIFGPGIYAGAVLGL